MYIIGSERSIILQTRKGNNVENFVNSEISEFHRNYFNSIEEKYPNAKKRSKPSGIYNCHGMTFASRRCSIVDTSEILKIIKDDNYTEISKTDILPGDIILYFSDGDIEHAGIIVGEPQPPLHIPIVISKWNCHAEFIHYANDCPYDKSNIKYYRIIE